MFLLSSPADEHIIVTLVDENWFTRMLSQGISTLIDKVLSFSNLFANLVELALWEYTPGFRDVNCVQSRASRG